MVGRIGLAADEQYPCALGLRGAWYGLFAWIANEAVYAVTLYGVLCAVLLLGSLGLLFDLRLRGLSARRDGLFDALPPVFVNVGILLVRTGEPCHRQQ